MLQIDTALRYGAIKMIKHTFTYMNDTLQEYYDKHNGRLSTEPIPDEVKECKDNKALKVFR